MATIRQLGSSGMKLTTRICIDPKPGTMGPIGASPLTHTYAKQGQIWKREIGTESAPRFCCILWVIMLNVASISKEKHRFTSNALLAHSCHIHFTTKSFSDIFGNSNRPNSRMAADGHLLTEQLAAWESQNHMDDAKGMWNTSA